MDIKTKYNIGDRVYFVGKEYNRKITKRCDLCRGAGYLINIEKESMECPNCKNGHVEEFTYNYIPIEGTIYHINILKREGHPLKIYYSTTRKEKLLESELFSTLEDIEKYIKEREIS